MGAGWCINKHMASIEARSPSKTAFHIKANLGFCLRNRCFTQISNFTQSNFLKSHFYWNSAPRQFKRDHSAGTEFVLISARVHDRNDPNSIREFWSNQIIHIKRKPKRTEDKSQTPGLCVSVSQALGPNPLFRKCMETHQISYH